VSFSHTSVSIENRSYRALTIIRVTRDRYFAAYPLMRIALDAKVVDKLGPRQWVEFSGSGQPPSLTAWFAGSYSNALAITRRPHRAAASAD
jgi:hypothetical protein